MCVVVFASLRARQPLERHTPAGTCAHEGPAHGDCRGHKDDKKRAVNPLYGAVRSLDPPVAERSESAHWGVAEAADTNTHLHGRLHERPDGVRDGQPL
jgi:hypothetical protein